MKWRKTQFAGVHISVRMWCIKIHHIIGFNIHLNTVTTTRQQSTMSAPAAKKATKPKKPAEHPTYAVMIAAAIAGLKDRTGSSRQAILKYICANYKVDAAKATVHLRLALKSGIAKGSLKMAKESGKGAGCYKLAEKPKKEKKPKKPAAAKKPAAKKPAAKKPAAKKPAAKKPKAAKKPAAAKKPKAAKKPAAKKPAAKKPAKK